VSVEDRSVRLAAIRAAVEAILFVADKPVPAVDLAPLVDTDVPMLSQVLDQLRADYDTERRGFELREVAGGWRLFTREEYAPYIERYVLDGQQARLTQAALETLAVVAYRQPVTRGRISAIRGVSVDGVIRTLLTRGLIEECGSEPTTGGLLYRTTAFFLEKLGIYSLDDLPSLAPLLPDLDVMDDVAATT
jgi:segregation and condensation protein B